jgi:hypothetical protein
MRPISLSSAVHSSWGSGNEFRFTRQAHNFESKRVKSIDPRVARLGKTDIEQFGRKLLAQPAH